MIKSFEALNELLERYHLITSVPLFYVVHAKGDVTRNQEDPPLGQYNKLYSSYDKEIICQAPITLDPFISLKLQGEGGLVNPL